MAEQTLVQSPRSWSFMLSPASGNRSVENVMLLGGVKYTRGQTLMIAAAQDVKLTPPAGASIIPGSNPIVQALTIGTITTAGDADNRCIGILGANIDLTGLGNTAVAIAARSCEVNGNEIVFPTESTAGGEKNATIRALASLGIEVRF